jgi:hypothetical protein
VPGDHRCFQREGKSVLSFEKRVDDKTCKGPGAASLASNRRMEHRAHQARLCAQEHQCWVSLAPD